MNKTIDAINFTRQSVEKILESLKFVNGDTLNRDQFAKLTKERVVFWVNRAQILDTDRTIFISVLTVKPDPLGKADKKVGFRRCRAYLDVITTKSQTDAKLLHILEQIEDAFEKEEWNFELVRTPETDDRSDKTTWAFEISKIQ